MTRRLLLFAAALLSFAACGPKPAKVAGIDYEIMDTTIRAGDDFAQYATGRWGDFNPQPLEYPMWGVTEKVYDDNVRALAALIQEIAAAQNRKGSVEQKIGDLYNMAMDSTRLNAEGIAPLTAHLAELEDITDRESLLAHMTREHDNLLFSMYISADEKNPDRNIVCISQGGLTMGNREYYVSDDPQNVNARELMKDHMRKLFMLSGYAEPAAMLAVKTIWDMETALAVPTYSLEQQRDPEGNYHKMSVDSLSSVCGGFPWRKYLDDYGYDRTREVDLGQPEPVAKACELLMNAPVEDIKTLYAWRIISSGSGLLSDDFIEENFDYSSKMYGTREKSPRWKRAEGLVENLMSDAIGQIYVKKYFPPAAKKEMLELISNLQASLGERIKAQEWMSDETKSKALEKLAAYTVKIGYPDKWDDLTKLQVDPALSLYDNVRKASEFYWQLDYDKHYEKPVDKSEWDIPAQMVNAFYSPVSNEICFPAGFLQPPLFDMRSDAAANYGSIGVVIGHEMTHGFDDEGRLYDKNGNLGDWWTEADAENFAKPCEAMAEYFNGLWAIPGELKANGVTCLGENIADHGGLNIAYDALQKWQARHGRLPDDNGFTPEQRFCLSYARLWAGTTSDEMLRYLVIIDVHSPSKLRVNGGLSQCDFWYEAFDIQPGDEWYVAPEDRVKVW